ncbi:class E sortase [Streptomyces sp. NPDC088354]|uniref:class E sortase n=1 Tax=Streptomyces sp. NPDC088354 TaxID=3365856 RepID=UPI003805013B
MTAHRHFGDTAEFAAVVEQLADPLNDPLPSASRRAERSGESPDQEQEPPAREPRRTAEETPGFAPGPYPPPPPGPRHAQPSEYEPAAQAQAQAPSPQAPSAPVSVPPWEDPAPQAPEGPRVVRRRPTEEERATARRRAAGAPGDTMAMPVVDDPGIAPRRSTGPGPDTGAGAGDEPGERPEPPRPEREEDGIPAVGGRAARRKAAQEAARRGGRGRRRSGANLVSQDATGALTAPDASTPAMASAPRSRLEARRAARAAKDSPGVIASRVVGEVFITFGVLMLLFVTYQLWWTNVLAHQQAGGAANNLQKQWEGEKATPRDPGAFSPGQGFAIMYIPKLDVKAPIAEGTDKHKVLDKGMIGHYDGQLETAMPWDKQGNFALAAHRNTHGEPFRYINKLVDGDKVVVETESTYYTYEVTSMLASTPPSNTSVIKPVPNGSGFTRPGRYITLTTCTPEFTSKYRLIVWGKMVEERPRDKGKPDALVE